MGMELKTLYKAFKSCSGVSIDTRSLKKGEMFFAIRGPHFDGNKFIGQALESGARFAVSSESEWENEDRVFVVKDTLATLQSLALYHRHQLDIPVLAITGSNGKTSSKELIRDVLLKKYRVHSTVGNLNNHFGIPLTLLRMPGDTEIAIIEMGANRQGDIEEYCQYTDPTMGYITNIGKAHLEGFGGIEGVEKGKTELFRFLGEKNGAVFYRLEDSKLRKHAEKLENHISFGQSEEADFQIYQTEDQPLVGAQFQLNGKSFKLKSQLTGDFNFFNLQAAIAIGLEFEVPGSEIVSALESYIPENNRSQLLEFDTHKVVLDAYNANPTSMELALRSLNRLPAEKYIAILGEMLEVGPDAEKEHISMAQLAVSMGMEVLLVGKQFSEAAKAFELPFFEDVHQAKAYYHQLDKSNAVVLVKGSRRNQLEKLFED
jgi:UDP-N-acetylmuramoyl-tripeptide--D-alanyl-D-alanine ligase